MGGLSGWVLVGAAVTSLSSASGQVPQASATGMAQAYSQPAYVQPAASSWEGYKTYLGSRARAAGVRESTIQAVIPYLRLNDRVIELDRAQRPTAISNSAYPPSFGPYLERHITSSLINRGQARYSTHWRNLSRIQSIYGVDPSVIIAIYGKETSYGAVTGSFDLLDALATLAYEGRRRTMFEDEFLAALKLLDRGVRRYTLKGSYAGATG